MVDLPKDFRLFQRAEIEYITPFLNLWLSFNCWYKKDSEADTPPITTDRGAINKYKQESRIKHYFTRFFNDASNVGKQFNEALGNLAVECLDNYQLTNNSGDITYSCLHKNPRVKNDKIKIGDSNYYLLTTQTDLFYEETIEIIYAVRCSLIHGNFDIDNKHFTSLVESSYKILYPLIGKVLE